MTTKVYAEKYTAIEMMTVASARLVKDHERVFVGTGFPLVATILSKKTHAPSLWIIYEAGMITNGLPSRTPVSVGDHAFLRDNRMTCGLFECFSYLQQGLFDVGFLGAAQIDKYGNLNSTCIGDYYNPKERFPGSGGAHDIAQHAKKTIVVAVQTKRTFVEKVDYRTSVGWLVGRNSRYEAGVPKDTGPVAVISNLGVYGFDPITKEMYLESYHRGSSVEKCKENCSWDLKVAPNVFETERPTVEELRLIEEEIDPMSIFTGWKS